MRIRIAAIGDIVGKPGRQIVGAQIKKLRQQQSIDFVIANAENAAGGSGLTPEVTQQLLDSGIDVLTGGDHIWAKKEILPFLQVSNRLLRPANYDENNPGKGYGVYQLPNIKIGVIHLQGLTFMPRYAECPFKTAEKIIQEIRKQTDIICVDFHAEATSEKIAMGRFLDGKVVFIFGTHTHVQTADETILPNGTAYITDIGMTGAFDSVIGRKVDSVLRMMLTKMPTKLDVATKNVKLCGAVVDVDCIQAVATRVVRFALNEDGKISSGEICR